MRFASRVVLMAVPLAVAGFAAHSASAQSAVVEQFNEIRDGIGLGKERAPIDFTERPPIVVPPSYALPPPGNEDPEHLVVNDPDVASRRKALSDPRRPVPPSDPGASAAGRNARTYLIDPPSGLRDPDRVASEITHDTAAPAPGRAKRAHPRKKKADAAVAGGQ